MDKLKVAFNTLTGIPRTDVDFSTVIARRRKRYERSRSSDDVNFRVGVFRSNPDGSSFRRDGEKKRGFTGNGDCEKSERGRSIN